MLIHLSIRSLNLSHADDFGAFSEDSLSRLGRRPLFISATGADSHSDAVFNYCKHMVCQQQAWLQSISLKYLNVKCLFDFVFSYFCKNTSGVARLEEQSTATYCVVIAESGEMSLGLGDMDIHQQITEQYVSPSDKSNNPTFRHKLYYLF